MARPAIVLPVLLALAGCASPLRPAPLPPDHPASPSAAEAPLPAPPSESHEAGR